MSHSWTDVCVQLCIYDVWRDVCIYVAWIMYMTHVCAWLSHICTCDVSNIYDMPHSYTWHASLVYVTRFILRCDAPHDLTHVWVIHVHVTCDIYIHPCIHDTPHSHTWHASLMHVTRCILRCDIPHDLTHTYIWHGTFVYAKRLTRIRDMPHP